MREREYHPDFRYEGTDGDEEVEVPGMSLFGPATYSTTKRDVAYGEWLAARQKDAARAATFLRPPFWLGRSCTKCGYGAETGDKAARVRHTTSAEHEGHVPAGTLGTGEALVRTCRRCKFVWAERPRDAD